MDAKDELNLGLKKIIYYNERIAAIWAVLGVSDVVFFVFVVEPYIANHMTGNLASLCDVGWVPVSGFFLFLIVGMVGKFLVKIGWIVPKKWTGDI